MVKILFSIIFLVIFGIYAESCLITNCPRGGKRSGKFGGIESNIKPCISCGPGHTGQCFGPNICCGPFGCLMGTAETVICQREGMFHESEPCIAGTASCRRNTGRCAMENVCCTQDSCHEDRRCSTDEKMRSLSENIAGLGLYNLMNNYPSDLSTEK